MERERYIQAADRVKFGFGMSSRADKRYSEGLTEFVQTRSLLAFYLNDNWLVDIGAGLAAPKMAKIVRNYDVSKYIAVDRFVQPKIHRLEAQLGYEGRKQDALLFLADSFDNSANVMINAIDETVIPPDGNNEPYLNLLTNEIARVAGSGHIVFGFESDHILERLIEFGFEEIELDEISSIRFYRKKVEV